jgi:hypothetical protein
MIHARAAIVSLVAVMAARPIAAQWHLGVELTTTHYRGTTRNTTDSGPTILRPADATAVTIGADRAIKRSRIAVRVSYARLGLVAGEGGLRLIDKSTGRLFEGSILANFQVVGIGGGSSGAIRAELGPALHLWNLDDDLRKRLAALGAIAYEWPVTNRFAGAVRFEGTISKSWFEPGDLPPELERRVTWRYGVGLGLRYRL